MSHLFRFFGHEIDNQLWSIDHDELEHLRKVLKMRVGDTLEVMNGAGTIAQGTLTELSKDHATVAVTSQQHTEKPVVLKALAIGALKPGDLDDILTDLVELGIHEIHVFQQTDTAKFRTGDKPKERWQRLIRSAAKQCKVSWCPTISTHDSLRNALTALSGFQKKLVLDATGQSHLLEALQGSATSVALVIGSERGLNPDELNLCQNAEFHLVKMGANILRARTAAVAATAILDAVYHKPGPSA